MREHIKRRRRKGELALVLPVEPVEDSRREAALPAALHQNRSRTIPPRPWRSLPTETQTQMAQLLAELLRRMRPGPPIRESTDGDPSNPV
ncbi:hypothetical protein ACD578_26015 (plasmid) [Microvirga sp. RSM25]|uniref:hypothetical protein n=1 Tax=Microvirga sp. RSM25 TaxID=3273802 RepID=UPI00384F417D